MRALSRLSALALLAVMPPLLPAQDTADVTRVRGEVTDAATGQAVACRIYIEGEKGTWHFPKSDAKAGAAFEYRKQRPDNPRSVEMHTTLSAHPFAVSLPPGRYTVTVERGKEYLPETRVVTVGKAPVDLKFELKRWTDMAARGWYSGDTHVHRAAVAGSSWFVLRCYEARPGNRVRFAHTAPFHVEVPGRPLRPRAAEIDYLIRRVAEQIARSKDVVPPAALAEYQDALRAYQAVKRAAGGGR